MTFMCVYFSESAMKIYLELLIVCQTILIDNVIIERCSNTNPGQFRRKAELPGVLSLSIIAVRLPFRRRLFVIPILSAACVRSFPTAPAPNGSLRERCPPGKA